MNIGKAIKVCRKTRGISQGELAEAIGMSLSTISLVERNKRQVKWSNLQAIAGYCNIHVALLVFLSEDETIIDEIGKELYEKMSAAILALLMRQEPTP